MKPSRLNWILTWVLAALPFVGYWTYGLFDVDEGFYGAVVAEMNRRHEWLTPYYNGHPWFEKPILLYWFAKPLVAAFGFAFGPRLASVLASLGLYAWVAAFVRRHFGGGAAQRTVLILASSLLVVAAGRMMLVDPLLNLCLSGSLFLFWESLGESRWARAGAGGMLGLSVLAKGPVGIVLFALIASWTYWKEASLRPAFRGGWAGFSAALSAVIAIWYLPVYLADGQLFVQKFLIEQNLRRFTGGDAAHTVGIVGLPLYFLVLLVGMAPWSFYLWRAWPKARGADEAAPSRDALLRYAATWAAVVVIFFTLAGAKLPHYVLPAAVPLAMIVGVYLARRTHQAETSPPLAPLQAAEAAGTSPDLRSSEGLENPKSMVENPFRLPGFVASVLVAWAIAQGGFAFYYNLSHAEVHRIAAYVKAQGGDVAAYQMPRRQHDLGTLKPEIQETSHPSLAMYLNKDVLEAETMDQLLNAPKPLWIITRVGRITDDDVKSASQVGDRLEVVPVPNAERHYALYRLTVDPNSRVRR